MNPYPHFHTRRRDSTRRSSPPQVRGSKILSRHGCHPSPSPRAGSGIGETFAHRFLLLRSSPSRTAHRLCGGHGSSRVHFSTNAGPTNIRRLHFQQSIAEGTRLKKHTRRDPLRTHPWPRRRLTQRGIVRRGTPKPHNQNEHRSSRIASSPIGANQTAFKPGAVFHSWPSVVSILRLEPINSPVQMIRDDRRFLDIRKRHSPGMPKLYPR